MRPFHAAVAASLLAVSLPAQMGPVQWLDFRVVDAEFSKPLRAVVAVAESPADALHIYDVQRTSTAKVTLPMAGLCVSVSPDGSQAVVGHDGAISLVDLAGEKVLDTITVPGVSVWDVVLASNGYAYVIPRQGQWVNIHCVDLSTRTTVPGAGTIRHQTNVRLHPGGEFIYGANNGLSPSDFEKYDITGGVSRYLYDSPYHGTYPISGNLWFTEDGTRVIVRGGHVFHSSKDRRVDMTHEARLTGLNGVQWAAHSVSQKKLLAIPLAPRFGGGTDDRVLQVYDDAALKLDKSFDFPKAVVNGSSFDTRGRFLFFEANGATAWAIVQADGSGRTLDFAVVRFDLANSIDPLSTDVNSISLSAGGQQTLRIRAGAQHAGADYVLLGSFNGTLPGIRVDSVVLPLNFDLVYLWHTFNKPNTWPLRDSMGTLDGQGQAEARFELPLGSVPVELAGLRVHHAYLVLAGGKAVFASNPVRVDLLR